MKDDNSFLKYRIKRENQDNWQRTRSHLDHAAGEYEHFLRTDTLFPKVSPTTIPLTEKSIELADDLPHQNMAELLGTVYHLKKIPWQGQIL